MKQGKPGIWSGVFLAATLAFLSTSSGCTLPRASSEEAQRLRAQLDRLQAELEHKKASEEWDRRELRLRQELIAEQQHASDELWDRLQKRLVGFEKKLDQAQATQPKGPSRLATAELRRELGDLRDLITDVSDQLSANGRQVSELARRSKKIEAKLDGLADEVDERSKDWHEKLEKRIAASLDQKLDKSSKVAGDLAKGIAEKIAVLTKDWHEVVAELRKNAGDGREMTTLATRIQEIAVSLADVIKMTEEGKAREGAQQSRLVLRIQGLEDRLAKDREHENKSREKLEDSIDALGHALSDGLIKIRASLDALRDKKGDRSRDAKNAEPTLFPEELSWDDPWLIGGAGLLVLLLLYLLLRKGPVEIEDRALAERAEPSTQASRQPARRDPVPSCVSIRIPSDEQERGADEAVRSILAADARVLVEPPPRLEKRTDGTLSVRFYAVGGLLPQELEELDLDCRRAAAKSQR